MLGILTFLAIFACARGGYVDLQGCRGISQTAENVTVDVSECTDPSRCPLVRGGSHTIIVQFVPTKNSTTNLIRRIYGVFHGLAIPYGPSEKICETTHDEDNILCKDTNGLIAGHRYTHKSVFPVQTFFPLLKLNVRYQYLDGKRSLVCVEIPVQIVRKIRQ